MNTSSTRCSNAMTMAANPVVVRRMMAGLRGRDVVFSEKGMAAVGN
ncbi:hypothetical protein ACFPOD_07875 [Nitratireductor kimnyeongensis]|uniref:Uncharacterized protein n=1 Tax=Nitratireductor kimnyeongensis TaxID=430679 RepID=A0ABW0T7Z7_9HYPH|nr:hypothetical protein [Nitratireductor kimnyeongensis]QZZ34037.1 hypothetical protein KW403_09330 [Nitratireductor kimnyeongensis]